MLTERLKELRKSKGLTQIDFAKIFEISKGTIAMWETNKRQPDHEMLSKIADYFDVTVDYLLGRTDRKNIDFSKITNIFPVPDRFIKMPIIGSISAGYDGIAQEEYLGDIGVMERCFHGYDPSECFILKVKGDSMYPDYMHGDIVAIHRQSSVDSGTVAAVLYNGDEATLKKVKYKQGEDWMELIPRNPEYQSKRIEGIDLEECLILGKVLSMVFRDLH